MNIFKILAILAISVPSVVFAQTAVRSVTAQDVAPSASVRAVNYEEDTNSSADVQKSKSDIKKDNERIDAGSAGGDILLRPTKKDNKRIDNGSMGGDILLRPTKKESTVCTSDAKICADGSGVGRVAPDCEFAKCPGKVESVNNGRRLDDDSDGDGISEKDVTSRGDDNGDESGSKGIGDDRNTNIRSKNNPDSFFDLFVDSGDEETKTALKAFIKVEGVEGDSADSAKGITAGRGDGEDAVLDGGDSETKPADSNIKKSKEIIVVGNKVRELVQDGKVEVRGWDPEKKEVTIKPENVNSPKDFLDLVGATVLSDENIESVSLDSKEIKMEYRQPAKLFGFIPMSLTAQVELSGTDQLKVKFPWYTFLTKNNAKEVKDEIDVLSFSWGAKATDEEDINLQDRARKFQAISNVLRASHDTMKAIIQNIKA